jgi:hypothetical protein
MNLHIIYTDTDVIVSKQFYNSWLEVQNEYLNYKTSLGSWSVDKVIEFLMSEYDNLEPNPSIQIHKLIKSTDLSIALRFKVKDNLKK